MFILQINLLWSKMAQRFLQRNLLPNLNLFSLDLCTQGFGTLLSFIILTMKTLIYPYILNYTKLGHIPAWKLYSIVQKLTGLQ